MTFYGLLWAAASNDQVATHFDVSLTALTVFFRIAVIAGPFVAFTVTRRLCLGLRQRERDEAEHGVETGRIRQLANGGFEELTEPPKPIVRSALRFIGQDDLGKGLGTSGRWRR